MTNNMFLTGWQRIGVTLSILWSLGVVINAWSDYERVNAGGYPFGGFAELRDPVTNHRLGNLSRKEAGELFDLEKRERLPLALWLAENQALKGSSKYEEIYQKLKHSIAIASFPIATTTPKDVLVEERSAEGVTRSLIVRLKISELILFVFAPLLCFWAVFFTLRWVVAGFRKPIPPL